MQKFFILWVSFLPLIIGGCTAKHYTISEPKVIVLKTPKIKFADTGYFRYDKDAVEVELFTAGTSVEKISIDDKVCLRAGCMDEGEFVKEYLYEGYPRDTLRRILQNEPIFGGINVSESCGGVIFQNIRNDEMDIMYRRAQGSIYFKDRLNGLTIKINDLDTNQSR
ncbi:MAG: hypothetical protein PHW64_06975 [Sulfuricurvum sp.]|nr:hypothetical protein [Sulfuricurvum sp.]